MKKLILILILFLLIFSCKTDKNKKDYFIKAYITGYFDGEVVLNKVRKGKLVPIDSLHMKKNKFMFKHVKIYTPEMFWFVIDKGNFVIQFFADPHDMQINADYNDGKLEAEGSETQKEYVSFLENNTIYENKQHKINEQKDIAYENDDTLLLKTLDSASNGILNEQIDFIKKYAFENNDSYVSLYLTLSNLVDYVNFSDLETIFNNFSDTLKTSPYYLELKDVIKAKKNVQIDRQAPDFSLPDTSGITVSLSSLQGKYVLIAFSASWNGACRSDNKILADIYEKYRQKGLEIYQVFAEQNMQQWKNVIRADQLNWISTSDIKGLDSEVLQLYTVRNLPQYFLLDKNGIIIASGSNLKEIRTEIKNLF